MTHFVRGAAWSALTAAAVLIVFAPALGPERTLARRDTARLIAPARALVADALRAGHLPLWNPHEGTGKPLFAEGLHSVLHPVSVLGALVAPGSADFLLVGYLLAAALGAFALARSLGASPAASAAAGVAFATSGFVVSMTGISTFLAGAGALAWMLAATRYAGSGAPFGAVACALSTAVVFLSGDTQMAIVGGVIGTALAVDRGGWRRFPRVALGMVAGALLAGVQIVASWSLLSLTTRGAELSPLDKVQWALHPIRLLEWLVPGLLCGKLPASIPVDVTGTAYMPGPFAESVFLGAVLLALASLGAAAAPRRTRGVLVASAVVLLWIALGHRLGARQMLDVLPVWNRFRFSEKMMAPLSLVLCASAALGIDRIGRGRLPRAARVALGVLALLSGGAIAAGAFAPAAAERALGLLSERGAGFFLENLRRGLVHPALGAAALLAVDRLGAAGRQPIAALLLVASTAAGVPFGAHFGLQEVHAVTSPMRLAAEPPGPRLAHPVFRELVGTERLDAIDVNIRLQRLVVEPSFNLDTRVDTIATYSGLKPWRLERLEVAFGERWLQAARRFGLTHVIALPPADARGEALVQAAIRGGSLAYFSPVPRFQAWAVPHRPWAFFAAGAVGAPAQGDAVERLVAAQDDATVIVETEEVPPTAPGAVLAASRAPEELRIEAEAPGAALLVVNDAYWPGWRAEVDGREVPVLPADVLVRAVAWPAGRHTLVMRYEPLEIRVGWGLSALGAAITALLAIAAARRPRASAAPSPPP